LFKKIYFNKCLVYLILFKNLLFDFTIITVMLLLLLSSYLQFSGQTNFSDRDAEHDFKVKLYFQDTSIYLNRSHDMNCDLNTQISFSMKSDLYARIHIFSFVMLIKYFFISDKHIFIYNFLII